MTPLAKAIYRRVCRRAPTPSHLEEACFFEVSEVASAAETLSSYADGRWFLGERLFLPKNPTWIEWSDRLLGRVGVLLTEGKIEGTIIVSLFLERMPGLALDCARIDPKGYITSLCPGDILHHHPVSMAIVFLAMINSPQVIGRKAHMNHSGFQKKLADAKGLVGKYPLQAWTELLLEVKPPKDESGLPERETMLTGERALHFVRAHLRIVNGKLGRVSAHWRGNAALGIKRTRYSVVPPKNGVWPKLIRGVA